MKNFLILSLLSLTFLNSFSQKKFKSMMKDMSINFYDVCTEADTYFETHDKNIKGSGWKGYQRWRNANEYKYYPSGDRSNIDPYFKVNAYKSFLAQNQTNSTKSLFDNGWEELGPSRIDSFSGHYSAGLGRIEDHYVNPTNTDLMYIGSRSGGFWKTTNAGVNWQACTDFLFASGVNTFGVSPTNSDSILINVRNSDNGFSHGIYRSTDGGNNFIESNFNPTTTGYGGLGNWFKIFEVRYHPRVPNLVFIGTSKGIYRSDDNLATWTSLYNSSDIVEINFHPTNNNIIYLYDSYSATGNRNYVLRSVDQGMSYSQSNEIIGNNNNGSAHLSVSNACADCVYFASDNGVWKSIDNGMNFTFIQNPDEGCGGFAVNDSDTSNMIYGYVDIHAKLNNLDTFHRVTRWSLGNTNGNHTNHQTSFNTSTNYVHADLHPAKSVNGVFYVGTDGLFCKSTDGGVNWEIIGQGIAVRENYKLGISQSNHYRSVSGSQDNGTSIKLKDTWLEFYGADGMEGLIHPLNDDYILGSLQNGGRRRTTDGGQTQGNGKPSGAESGAWVAPLTYSPNNQMTIYDFRKNVYKSENFAVSYDSIGKPSTFTGTIKKAAIAENNSDIIVISKGSKIEKSIDGGSNFVSIKNNLPSHSIQDIAFDPNNDDVIIVVNGTYQNNGEKVYITIDGGDNWTNITHNLGDMPIRSVVIDHTDSSYIYIGAEIGVFVKSMNSNNWELYNPNLPNCSIEELEINYGSNTIKVATWGRGLWEYSLKDRNDFPSIVSTKITNQPTIYTPKETQEQFVTSEIKYDNTLNSVYLEWSIDNPTFGNVITMTNTGNNIWVSNTALPTQAIDTKMFFKVFAVGSNNDTSETYKFMYKTHPFEYCAATGSMSFQGNITLVNFNSINKATGKTQAYNDYTSIDSTTVKQGQIIPISVNLNTDNGGNYNYYAKAWIDWNQNADFEDNESYELGKSYATLNGITDLSPFNINVPIDAKLGRTRMRVICKYNSYASSCDINLDGEVEDYTINVEPTPNLNVNVNEQIVCAGEFMYFNYTGDAMSSIQWTFSNGSDLYVSTNFTDSLIIDSAGIYNVHIETSLSGNVYSKDSNLIFEVPETYFTHQSITCNASDSGISILNLKSKYNCDSIVTITNIYQSLDATITNSSNSLFAEPSGFDYQWLDCDKSFSIIQNESGQIYNTTSNGNYAVQIFDGQCTDTSDCVLISGVGIIETNFDSGVKVFPNPTKGEITVEFESSFEKINYSITNVIGQNILNNTIENNNKIIINLSDYIKGVYFLNIRAKEKFAIFKIVKE